MSNPLVTILIPHYKTLELTKLCLRLIRKHTSLDLAKIIVIDNGSQDESTDYLRTLSWITLIERPPIPNEPAVLAHSRALDLALQQVETPYVLSIHTDTLVRNERWLPFLLSQIDADPTIGGVGSWKLEAKPFWKKILKYIEETVQKTYYRLINKKDHGLVGHGENYYYLRSHCALYRTHLLRDYQTDFSDGNEVAGKVMHRKLIQQGHKMIFLPSSVLLAYMDHINHATTVLNPQLSRHRKSVTKGLRRIQKSLESFNATAILQDNTLDHVAPRKNILIIAHSYPIQFLDINNQYTSVFDKKNYQVYVAYLSGKPNEDIRKKHLTEDVIFLNASKKELRGLKISLIKKFYQLHKEKKFSLVICHRYKPTYIMLIVSCLCKIPLLIAVMHDLNTLKSFSRRIIINLLAKKNTFFAGVSNAVRDNLRHHLWKNARARTLTLYNMINVIEACHHLLPSSIARAQFSLSPEVFLFGTIGRLTLAKDHATLLKAFALIKPICINSKLVIIGDGSLEKTLKHQAEELGIATDVIFTGYIENAAYHMKALDVFILSSTREAFGRVLLEAMLAHLPVIATRINGIPEVIDNAGILIDAQQPEQLAKAMLSLYQLSEKERSLLAEQG